MRCLVTGGAGFIGSHLAEALLDRGDEVCVIDDLSTGRLDNVRHLHARNGFTNVVDSVLNRDRMAALVQWADATFHLAAIVGVRLVVEQPARTIETNVQGTATLLELAAPKRQPVVLFSSSEVYGQVAAPPSRESDDLILGPPGTSRWSYAASKLVAECLALAARREHDVPVVIVRLFNTVGPRQSGRYGMVLPRFVEQALGGRPITVHGDGAQTRTFLHVHDAVDAILALAGDPKAVGEIFNVGGDEEISIAALADRVKEVLRSDSEVRRIPYEEVHPPGFEDIRRRAPHIGRLSALIGWRPRRGLTEMILDVARFQRAAALGRP